MGNMNWKDFIMKYKIHLSAAAVICIIIVVALVRGCGKEEEQQPVQPESEVVEEEAVLEPENNLEENSHASIDRLIEKYCEYIASGDVESLEDIVDVLPEDEKNKIQNRARFIERYDNIKCYTKNGPVEDSFIVFVCYDMKLIGIETSAPDIICLYVGPKSEDTGRRIHYGTIDESMQAYVTELEKDPEVQALYDDVSRRYQEAQDSDEALADFIRKISGQVAESSDEEASEAEGQEEAPAEEEQPAEEEAEAPAEEPAEAVQQNRETRVTESVNVRAEASTDSERLALAYQGDPITQLESYEDGWSKVEYKGLTGYVKTEFLE